MSGSTLNNCSANEPTCLCGIEVSISTRFGLVEVSFGGGHIVDGELIFTDNQSIEWREDLGVDYILNFSYNTVLGRWELSYDDIVIGVFYSDSQCPLSECDWDLDCIAIDFIPNGDTAGYYSWTGEYFNGRKAYYFSSDWDGVSTIDYQIVWDLIPPSAGAPVGTYAWILSDVTEGEPIFINFLYTTGCPYGEYLSEWGGEPTRFEIANPGVSDYILQTKAAECGCCDTTLQLEVGVVELGIVTVDASVEYDLYGNILGINGKPYYVFEAGESTYYLFFLDGEWVVKTSLGGPFLQFPRAVLESNSDCPYGFYSTDLEFYSFWVRGIECFDCCDYYAPRFTNFIKKKKYDLVGDISSIRNKEIFGMKCGPEWSDLFRKHLILDVLSCLPYGVLCEEEEQCLIKNVNENCNC